MSKKMIIGQSVVVHNKVPVPLTGKGTISQVLPQEYGDYYMVIIEGRELCLRGEDIQIHDEQ